MLLEQSEPIYALASGLSGAIAIIRLSGENTHKLLLGLIRTKKGKVLKPKMRYMHYANLFDGEQILDDICLVFYAKGKSYTDNEMAEIFCHSSQAIILRLGELLEKQGFRQAKPGEFTKRAFLNGKLELSQAEAVRELIEADSLAVANIAIKQLNGELKNYVLKLREELVDLIASIEANLDYPEEDIEDINKAQIIDYLTSLSEKLSLLSESYLRYKLNRDGLSVAIIGKPNSGKSSLLNALLKEDRAIVTDIAGTTRDHIEESFNLKGYKFKLIDTAGIRETDSLVEKIGIERAKKFEQAANLILYIYDGTEAINEINFKTNALYLINKNDLTLNENNLNYLNQDNVISISALKQKGLDRLSDKMLQFAKSLCDNQYSELPIITQARHQQNLKKAIAGIKLFQNSLDNNIPLDIALVELYEVKDYLGEITGIIYSDDILNRIFEKFCIGK